MLITSFKVYRQCEIYTVLYDEKTHTLLNDFKIIFSREDIGTRHSVSKNLRSIN